LSTASHQQFNHRHGSDLGRVAQRYSNAEDLVEFSEQVLEDQMDQTKIQRLELGLESAKEQLEVAKYRYEQQQLNEIERKERDLLSKMG